MSRSLLLSGLGWLLLQSILLSDAFVAPSWTTRTKRTTLLFSNNNEEDAERLRQQAETLREQIRQMEEQLGDRRDRREPPKEAQSPPPTTGQTLNGKRILVAGANGRLGSMVCRYLLRNHPKTEVVAAVHYVGENSPTARGYGRLSCEVGAEDGLGSIGAAWSAEDRTATFEYDPATMADYNLQNLRLVECELLDPVQCRTVVEGCDAVIWCATDFNGNQPRAVSGLNVAFLFRAVTRPDKGRVEIEGLQNMLGALKTVKQDRRWKGTAATTDSTDPIHFVLVSTAPEALADLETPFGSFVGLKRQGEAIMLQDFPSLSSTVLQMARYDDNFVHEGLEIQRQVSEEAAEVARTATRRINRRDAAKAVVDALTDESLVGQTIQVWTAER